MRRAAKTDANQREIVAALRAVGARVQHLHAVGRGCPDILVAFRGRLFALEIKAAGGTLTPDEAAWWREWLPVAREAIAVVRSPDDALRAIGAM